MDKQERRAQGAHYTTEKNILKVIEPLFLGGLRAEFTRLRARRDTRRLAELQAFQERLGQLKFSPQLTAYPQRRRALETDWSEVIAPADCSYLFGNPPFSGAEFQSPAQREQVRRIARLGGNGGTLDYVAA